MQGKLKTILSKTTHDPLYVILYFKLKVLSFALETGNSLWNGRILQICTIENTHKGRIFTWPLYFQGEQKNWNIQVIVHISQL